MSRRRVVALLLAVTGVLVLWAGWLGYQAWQVQQSLTSATRVVAETRAAVGNGDTAAVAPALATLRDDAQDAEARTAGWSWSLATHLPWVGDDAEAVQVASSVLDELAAGPLTTVVDVLDRLDSLAPQDGRVDVGAVESLQEPVSTSAAAMSRAAERLTALDPSGLVEPLRSRFVELVDDAAGASDALSAADRAVQVLPEMLGAEGERRYLLVFQNNAEIRSTGGLPGSVALVTADDGRIDLVRQEPGNGFGERDSSVLPLTDGELSLYGPELGTYFLDAGFTPDFQRAAELWTARWQERFPGRIDGVLGLDTVAVGYLMRGMEPITVDGVTLTSETIVDELLHEVYLRYDEPADQDLFFEAVAGQVFERVTAGDISPTVLLPELARAGDEGRAQLASFNDSVSEQLAGTAVLGPDLDEDAEEAAGDVLVTFDDTTAAKLSYFLRTDVRVRAAYCMDERQAYDVDLRLESTAPRDPSTLPDYVTGTGPRERGTQVVTIRVYSPVEGALGDLEINGAEVETDERLLEGREVLTTYVGLAPGQVSDVSLRMVGAPGHDGETRVYSTPTLESGAWSQARTACRG